MARGKKAAKELSPEEKLQQALVPVEEQPYLIPENWCWCKISSICNFERGITFPASAKEHEATETNIPCLRTANIQDELEIDDLLYVDISYMKNNKEKYVYADDIIMSSANSRELVGKVSYVYDVPIPMTFGGFVLAIRAKNIYSKYLFYYLRFEFLTGKFMRESTQTTNIANINTTKLGAYEFPLSPLLEQHRIVSRIESLFSKLDKAREKAQAVVDGFALRRSAILHKAFTGELTERWRKEHGVGLDSWKRAILIDVLKEKPRNGYSPKPVDYATPYKSMTLSATTSGVFKDAYFKYVDETIPEDSYLWLKPGDILIQRANSLDKVGTSAIYTGQEHEFIYPDLMMKLQVAETTSPQFVAYSLKRDDSLAYFRANATGTAGNMPKINQQVVSQTPLSLPTFEEQIEIVRILESLFIKAEQAKQAAEAVIARIDTMKKAVLGRAFRGELGTNDPAEGWAGELVKAAL